MCRIFEVNIGGRQVTCIAIVIDGLQDRFVPHKDDQNDWAAYRDFVVARSQAVLGKWPVHFFEQSEFFNQETHFTGFRINAKCVSLRPDNPEIIEYGILVWHQQELAITADPPETNEITWSDFAEAMEV